MTLPEYDRWDAHDCAEKVGSGELSPQDLLVAATERIEARNPALNCVVNTLYERAKERLDRLPEGPLRGVPFLVKDLKLVIAGTATTNSTRLRSGHVSEVSSVLAERYEAAGLQIVGKTNTPEFGIMGITEPDTRGPCRNPWNTDHTPGGSSGGSSSAVAARMVPLAHGGDGGGSIRIPASATGLFGLKPTRGRVTMAPLMGEAWNGFVQEHVLARSVRDSALMLDIESGAVPGDPYAAPPIERPFRDEVDLSPGRLRIGWTTDPLYAGSAHPDTTAAVHDAVKLLEDLGHELVESTPPFPREELVQAYFRVIASHIAWFVESTSAEAGKSPSASDYEAPTWLLAQIGWKTRASELVAASVTIQKASRQVAGWFEQTPLFLCPTLAGPPLRVGELALKPAESAQLAVLRALNSRKLLDMALQELGTNALAATPNTQLFNMTGQPAMSVPLYWNQAGLPIGVQLAAPFGCEGLLFRLAAQLEQARPWAHRLPPLLA